MQDTLPAAFQAIRDEVLVHLAGFALTRSTPEERGGSALVLAEIVRKRSPQFAQIVAVEAEKAAAKRGKHGRD